ncbi:hypothetical protein QA640_39065 [Bradyrhizobium sp. CB82]|uniref:hypothetical protein n=1 Tax=Bradyrhizobium sp. CB82 TaxID=3039159 RepID=UPI0024B07C2D|nr:hypothetical protein [Bradyrhizobium sp. CB82]WFU40151.1 hypothetical protein QA640_39065 [Bradyrhizobium sp. CB82]
MTEPMTPLQTISDWFEKQHAEIQGEISAGMALLLNFNDTDFLALDNEQQGEFLQQWLSEVELPTHAIVGRALTFRACFEFFAECRFTELWWKQSEKLFREALEETTDNPHSDVARFSPTAQRLLDDMPARKSRWIEGRQSWRELADGSLTPSALRKWITSQMRGAGNDGTG